MCSKRKDSRIFLKKLPDGPVFFNEKNAFYIKKYKEILFKLKRYFALQNVSYG